MMVTRKHPAKKKKKKKKIDFSELCKKIMNYQSNDSLAFQQHASGQFSVIKPCLGVVFDLRTHPSLCNLAIVMGFLLRQIYWVVVFKPL